MSFAQPSKQPGQTSASAKGAPEQARLWTKDFVVGTATNFLLMMNYYMLMVVMTSYALNVYAAPASVAGLAASMFIIGALIARFAATGIMQRLGRKRVLVAGIALEIAFSSLYLAGTGFALLFALRFVHGFVYGVCSTTVSTVVTGIVPASRKGEGVGYYMLSSTLGAAIGPFLGIFVSTNVGYSTLFVAGAAVVVCGLWCALALNTGETRTDKTAAIGKTRAAATPTDEAHEGSAQDAGKHHGGIGAVVRSVLEVSIFPISTVCMIVFFAYSSLLTFMTPFATELGLAQAASVFFVVYALAMFLTRPLTGKMFDRRGANTVMIPAFVLFILGMALLSRTTSDLMLLGSAVILGVGVGAIQSSGLALAVKDTPGERLSAANATFYVFLDVGVGIGPLILGALLPALGYRNLFLAMAAVGFAGFVLYLAISRSSKTRAKASARKA